MLMLQVLRPQLENHMQRVSHLPWLSVHVLAMCVVLCHSYSEQQALPVPRGACQRDLLEALPCLPSSLYAEH